MSESNLDIEVKKYFKELEQLIQLKKDTTKSPLEKEILQQVRTNQILDTYIPVFGRDLPGKINKHIASLENEVIKVDYENASFNLFDFIKKDFSVYWLSLNYFTRGGFYLFAAKAKSGKTDFINYMTRCHINDGEFLGMPCLKGKVVWFQLEESNASLFMKAKQHGYTDIVDPEHEVVVYRSLDIYNDFSRFAEIIKQEQPILVIIDTIRSSMSASGLSETDASYADPFYKVQALAIQENVTIIGLHHVKKSGGASSGEDLLDKISGTSKLPTIGDGSIILERKGVKTFLHFITRDIGRKSIVIQRKRNKQRKIDFTLVEEIGVTPEVIAVEKKILRFLHNSKEKVPLETIYEEILDENVDTALDRLCDSFLIDFNVNKDVVHYFVPDSSNSLWKQYALFKDLDRDIETANKLMQLYTQEEIIQFTKGWDQSYKNKIWELLSSKSEQLRISKILIPPKYDNTEVEYKKQTLTARAVAFKDTYLYNLFDEDTLVYENVTEAILV